MGGGSDPSWSECRACGVHGCPSSPLIIDPQPARAELGTASSHPPSTGAARAVLDETFPQTRPANSDFHQQLEQLPSAPLLVEQALNEIPTTPPVPEPTPAPTLIAAAFHQEQQAAINQARQYMGESSPTPPPPPPPQYSPDNEVPIQRVDDQRDYSFPRENDQDQPGGPGPSNNIPPCQPAAGEGTIVQDNIVIGDPTKVTIGEGNRGGRSTRGRVTGNVVMR